jgi:hypothetical protein
VPQQESCQEGSFSGKACNKGNAPEQEPVRQAPDLTAGHHDLVHIDEGRMEKLVDCHFRLDPAHCAKRGPLAVSR